MGPHFVGKLVAAFGEGVFAVIERSPERLLEVDGIGKAITPRRPLWLADACGAMRLCL
jgi:hypothetical protein